MPFALPTADQKFIFSEVSAEAPIDWDTLNAIIEGAAGFAAGEFEALNRIGDTVGARYANGRVTMPEGYKAAWNSYVAGGWGTLDAPEAFGGQGLGFAMQTIVLESLGTANMALTLCPILSSGAIEAIQAGSDVGALRSTAVPNGDGSWSIKGTKIYITFGEHDLAENIVHLVLARTPGAPAGTKGISLFLVPKFRPDASGSFTTPNDVRCSGIEHKLGINASPTCTMVYGDNDDCQGWLIGPEMGGMRAMFTMMNNARLNVGSQGVQIAERATQAAVAYARDRVQVKPIIEHPDVRRMLLRMKALTQGARALLYAAAASVDAARTGDAEAKARVDLLTPLVKAWGTDIGCEVASLGVQVHGGMGFVEETGAAQYYRDIRIAPIYEGTNGIQAADLVGRKLTGDGGAALKALIAATRVDGAGEPALLRLCDAVDGAADWMLATSIEDRLAGSYPFLDMVAVMAAGALMARQNKVATDRSRTGDGDPVFLKAKVATTRFFLDHIVPEALGKAASATAGAAGLYALTAEELAA